MTTNSAKFALIPPDQKGDSSLNNSMSMSASIRPQVRNTLSHPNTIEEGEKKGGGGGGGGGGKKERQRE